ncbi:MAG: hypothetical protein K0Q65_2906, partial [Clostridia bacterium]|nr:hypothetical protein [Clostridia bacterium]
MKAYINAKIYTLDANNPEAGYLVEKDGRIVEIGKNFEKSKYAGILAQENIIDLEGSIVTPAFWESHLHI